MRPLQVDGIGTLRLLEAVRIHAHIVTGWTDLLVDTSMQYYAMSISEVEIIHAQLKQLRKSI